MSKKPRRKIEISLSSLLLPDEKRQYLDYLISKATTLQGRKRYLLVDLMLNSGLRAQEICNLKLKHTPEFVGAPVLEVYKGKGNKDRTVPIPKRLADAIEQYIKQDRSSTKPRYTKRSDPNGQLFFNQLKRKYKPAALYQMAKRAGERARIPKRIRPHIFRHTFATNALENGMTINELQKRLGHTDLRVTALYLHVVGSRDFELAERCDQV